LKNLFEKFIFSLFNLNSKITNNKSILLAEFNPAQYDLLIKELSKLDKNVILLNQRRSAIWNFDSFKIIKNSKCKILSLHNFEKKIHSIISIELNKFSKNLQNLWKLEKDFVDFFLIDSFSIWKSIEKPFCETCSQRFLESVKRILLLNEFFKNYNIDVILEWAELGQEEKELLLVSKKFDIKSIMLQHALDTTYPGWNRYHRFVLGGFSYSYISDKQALWGELPRKQALCYPNNSKDDFLITGSPRHDKFFLEKKNKTPGIILLATTGVTGISQIESPFESYEKFDIFIREVCKIIKKFPDKKLIVKTHPRSEFDNPITDLIQEIDQNIAIVYDANLIELINSCEMVITFNNSTIALESLILEKPTISLQMESWAESEDIVKMGALISISRIDDIEPNITKIIKNEEFRNSLLKNGKTFVEQYMSYRGKSSKILAQILDKL
jgi:UDP-N-acetylglucosamine 2-epimerase